MSNCSCRLARTRETRIGANERDAPVRLHKLRIGSDMPHRADWAGEAVMGRTIVECEPTE